MDEKLVQKIGYLDRKLIPYLRKISLPLGRFALFVVFFWFGILKILKVSSAEGLVAALLAKTLPFISFNHFIVFLGILEMVIGILFIIPGLERLALPVLIPHMLSTVAPLVLLPSMTWKYFMVPTLEGQYIIKNLVIIALAFLLAAHLTPLKKTEVIS